MLTTAQLCAKNLNHEQLVELERQGHLLDAGPRLAARWALLAEVAPQLVNGKTLDLDDPASGPYAHTCAEYSESLVEINLAEEELQPLLAARTVVADHCGFRHLGHNVRHISWMPSAWPLVELMAVDPLPIRLLSRHGEATVLVAPETLSWLREDADELAIQLLAYELQAKLAVRLGHSPQNESLGALIRDTFIRLIGLAVRDWQLQDQWPSGRELIRVADHEQMSWLMRRSSPDFALPLSLRPLLRLVESALDASDRAVAARLDTPHDHRTIGEWRDFFSVHTEVH